MRIAFSLFIVAAIAGCSQQDMCVSRATKDLRVVNSLVREAQTNLARGYAVERYEVVEFERQKCGENAKGEAIICRVPEREYRTRPVAINLDEERAKLVSLQRKQAELQRSAQAAKAACVAAYPQ